MSKILASICKFLGAVSIHCFHTFSIYIGVICNPQADPAVSRKPEQSPLQTFLSYLHFSGTNKGCRFDDTPNTTSFIYVWHDICINLPSGMVLSFLPPSAMFCLLVALWWPTLLSLQINWKLIWLKSIFSRKSEPVSTLPVQLHTHRATGPSGRWTREQGLLLLALLAHVGSTGAAFEVFQNLKYKVYQINGI